MAGPRYDVIVIGAGHNGLTAACMLRRKGHSVLVVERRDVTGGLCAGESFHPGYRSAGLLHDTAGVRPAVVDSLRLVEHGLEFDDAPAPVLFASRTGRGILLGASAEEAQEEIGQYSARDAARYREYRHFVERARRVIEPLLNEAPADVTDLGGGDMMSLARHALALRALGRRDMMELLRVPPMCVADWMREWFETERLCAGLAHPAILGTWCGPWSPGTAANLLLRESTAGRPVRGGAAALAASLERAARDLGVEIRTGTAVERIVVRAGAVAGVVLPGGEEIGAGAVAASCDPKTTLLSLVDPADVSGVLAHRVETFRARGTTAHVSLALNRPLEFACRPGVHPESIRTGDALDEQERAFDAVKYRGYAEHPVLDIYVPSIARPECAPDTHASVSILAHFVPFQLEGGWDDAARERLGDTVVAELERYAPGVSSAIVARDVLTPLDIETRFGTSGGHIHHGEHALDQLITRPTPETARYATPIAGLFLCGSGSHPGGGVTCAPGAIASRVIAPPRPSPR